MLVALSGSALVLLRPVLHGGGGSSTGLQQQQCRDPLVACSVASNEALAALMLS